MGILQPLTKDVGHFKSGIYGDTGSGKTTTAALIAIGLYRHRNLKGPIAFYDSERGSGFVRDLFTAVNIDLVGVRSRSFKDLVSTMVEVEKSGIEIIIIDSITHPWRELLTAYKERVGRKRLSLSDWGPIKDEWHRGYSQKFVNAKANILMCGRQQNIFEDIEDDTDDGEKKKWRPIKVGTRMATEGETGYEPNLLIEMERRLLQDGGAYARVACVLKDRSFHLDGAECVFNMPMTKGRPDIARLIEENKPFQFVLPHIQSLDPMAAASAPGVQTESSAELFTDSGQTNRMRDEQERELLIGNCEQLMNKYYPSRDKLSMKAKADIIEGTTWAMDRRTRNWDFVGKKFNLEQVRLLYMMIDLILLPEKRPQLEEALALGLNDKGGIDNADAAPEAVRRLCAKSMAQGQAVTKNDLPF